MPVRRSPQTILRQPGPIKLGLSGSLASGKTTCLEVFESLGYRVLSADAIVHEIYNKHKLKLDKLRRDCLKSKSALKKLENFVHPKVRAAIRREIQRNKGALIIEVPLLFEGGLYKNFDANIFVYAPKSVRKKRALARGMKPKLFQFLDSRQLPARKKAKMADFVLHNWGDRKSFKRQCRNLANLLQG